MGALVWLVIPAVAVVAAALWGRWAGRRRITGDGASLAGYERFRVAMEKEPLTTAGERTTDDRATDDGMTDDGMTGERTAAERTTGGRTPGDGAAETADAQLTARIDARLAAGAAGTDEEGSPRGPVAGSVP